MSKDDDQDSTENSQRRHLLRVVRKLCTMGPIYMILMYYSPKDKTSKSLGRYCTFKWVFVSL